MHVTSILVCIIQRMLNDLDYEKQQILKVNAQEKGMKANRKEHIMIFLCGFDFKIRKFKLKYN